MPNGVAHLSVRLAIEMRKFIIFSPILLFIAFIVIKTIPHGFSIMSEEIHPWYTPYTSLVFPFLAIFFFPVTLMFKGMDAQIMGLNYSLAALIYSLSISFIVSKLWKIKRDSNGKA